MQKNEPNHKKSHNTNNEELQVYNPFIYIIFFLYLTVIRLNSILGNIIIISCYCSRERKLYGYTNDDIITTFRKET